MEGRAERAAEPPVEILPENAEAVRVFLAMSTQWMRAGIAGVPTGLVYAALPIVAGVLDIAVDDDLLGRVQIMEAEALQVMLADSERR